MLLVVLVELGGADDGRHAFQPRDHGLVVSVDAVHRLLPRTFVLGYGKLGLVRVRLG